MEIFLENEELVKDEPLDTVVCKNFNSVKPNLPRVFKALKGMLYSKY